MDIKPSAVYEFVMHMVVLILCITIHEFAHAYSAYRAGDMTPKEQGRISLNPIDHLDLVGTIMMVVSSLAGFGIGWGKPVRINPANFHHPRWDNLRVSLWGPLSNLITACVFGLVLRLVIHNGHISANLPLLMFLFSMTIISISLAIFNLIPIAPLDGSHIISALLPVDMARNYDIFMARHGMMIFLLLIVFGGNFLGTILGPPVNGLFFLLTGTTLS